MSDKLVQILSALLFGLSLLVSGCQTYSEVTENQKLDKVLYSYEKNMRWGNLEGMVGFMPPDRRATEQPNPEWGNVQITSYRVFMPAVRTEEGKASQTVVIQYMFKDTQVVRELRDQQLWELDATDGNWYIVSPLPVFK